MKSKTGGRATYFDRTSGLTRESQEDWKETLLCGGCEQAIKVRYEDFINELLFLRRKIKTLVDTDDITILTASNNHLALALLSIFWRAIVSSLPEFKFVAAPGYIESELRTWIYRNSIPPNWQKLVCLKIVQFKNFGTIDLPLLATPFFRQVTKDQAFDFVFVFGGYCVTFTIPPPPNFLFIKSNALRSGSNILRIEKVHHGHVPEVGETLAEMIAALHSKHQPK
jgi:hypothetical protein